MNHLVGLNVPDPTADLPPSDDLVLSRFREAFEAKKPADCNVPLTHEILSSGSLPPCGWRPLDDATLYRFLCADRDKGKFHPEASLKRLLNALRFRKDRRVDEILNIGGPRLASVDSTLSALTASESSSTDNRLRVDSLDTIATDGSIGSVKTTSICLGTLCEEYLKVNNFRRSVVKQVAFKNQETSEEAEPQVGSKQRLKKQGSLSSLTTATTACTSVRSFMPTTTSPPPPPSCITLEQLEKYQRLRVRVFVGRDHQGNPIMLERLGEFLGSGNVGAFTMEDWLTLYIWDMERHLSEMRQAALATGKPIEKYVFLGDLQGIVRGILMGQIWCMIPLLKAVQTVEQHYPEIVSHIVVFNVPKVAMAVWDVIRRVLDPVTATKVQLKASLPKEFALEYMEEATLPIAYGGANTIAYPKTAKA